LIIFRLQNTLTKNADNFKVEDDIMNFDKLVFADLLLKWWKDNKRDLSWRRTNCPYSVLVAELLLKKTTAVQVARVYDKILGAYPSPEALCSADRHELGELLKPLGMSHRRTDILVKLGCALVREYNGEVPLDRKELLKLPGVGPYTANAVLVLIQSEELPLLDTNFIRIIQRVFRIESSKSRARSDEKLWRFAGTLIPQGKGRKFNLAVLDFAALVCTARNPKCESCPVKTLCAHRSD
jgi:A/G-specific adenine glycosylase